MTRSSRLSVNGIELGATVSDVVARLGAPAHKEHDTKKCQIWFYQGDSYAFPLRDFLAGQQMSRQLTVMFEGDRVAAITGGVLALNGALLAVAGTDLNQCAVKLGEPNHEFKQKLFRIENWQTDEFELNVGSTEIVIYVELEDAISARRRAVHATDS